MEILALLRRIGYEVRSEGDVIRCRWERPGLPDRDEAEALLAALRQHKTEALEALRLDPFNTDNHLPPDVVVCLEDRDRSGWWVAKRVGVQEPRGHGEDQVDAILDLDRKEKYRATGQDADI